VRRANKICRPKNSQRRSWSKPGRDSRLRFLNCLSAEVPLIIEEPDEKGEDQHGSNQPGLDGGKVGENRRRTDHRQHIADRIEGGFAVKSLDPEDASFEDAKHDPTLPAEKRGRLHRQDVSGPDFDPQIIGHQSLEP